MNTIELLIQFVALPMRQKHSKLTVLEGEDAFSIRHTHLAIKFRRPSRPIPTEPINRIHMPEGVLPQTSAPVQQACCIND
jgi:hypothetical protein